MCARDLLVLLPSDAPVPPANAGATPRSDPVAHGVVGADPNGALLVVAAHMCNAEVPQVVRAAETARQNTLNRRPIACPVVKA